MALSQYEPVLQIVERGAMPLTPDARFLVFRSRVARHLRAHRLELASLPEVATSLLAMAPRTANRTTALARAIWRDPGLAEETLSVVSSRWYGAAEPVRDLRAAIYRLGPAEVRNVVVALALRRAVFRVRDLEDEGDHAWRHALATAIAAREVAADCGVHDPDMAFLAGLFHNVGYGTVLKASAEVYRLYLTRADWQPPHVRAVALQLQAEVGSFLARRWRLDESIVDVVGTGDEADENASPLARAVTVARAVAAVAGISPWPSGAPVYGAPPLVLLPSTEAFAGAIADALPNRVRAFVDAL